MRAGKDKTYPNSHDIGPWMKERKDKTYPNSHVSSHCMCLSPRHFQSQEGLKQPLLGLRNCHLRQLQRDPSVSSYDCYVQDLHKNNKKVLINSSLALQVFIWSCNRWLLLEVTIPNHVSICCITKPRDMPGKSSCGIRLP